MVPGTYEVIAGGLAGAVGAIRFVLVGFRERWIFFTQRTIDFVSRYMQKAESSLLIFWQVVPVTAYGFEQVKGADDVGLNEFTRTMNGAIHMALGGEVDDSTGLGIGQQVGHQSTITNVATNKLVAWVTFQLCQVLEVSGVSKQIEIHNWFIALLEPVEDEVGTDEAGGACNKNCHTMVLVSQSLNPAATASL